MTKAEIKFLNVDFELFSKQDLSPLKDYWGEDIIINHIGKIGKIYHFHFSISHLYKKPETVIKKLCQKVAVLPKKEKEVWLKAEKRIFDIGYESGTSPRCFENILSESIIKEINENKGTIKITIYPLIKGKI